MHSILIRYTPEGKISEVCIDALNTFTVTEQKDTFVGGKLTSTELFNTPVQGGDTDE